MLESAEQMHARLCSVIAAARFEALSQPYAWEHVSEPSGLYQCACGGQRRLGVVRAGRRPAKYRGGLSHPGISFCRRLERFGLRCLARWNHEERGGNWCPVGVRLRRSRDAGTVANLTRPVRLLGGPWDRGDEVAALVDRLRREGAH